MQCRREVEHLASKFLFQGYLEVHRTGQGQADPDTVENVPVGEHSNIQIRLDDVVKLSLLLIPERGNINALETIEKFNQYFLALMHQNSIGSEYI